MASTARETNGAIVGPLEPRAVEVAGGAASTVARVLSAIVFAALLAILPLSAAPYGSVEAWWTALFDAAIFALAALWAIESALRGAWLRRSHVLLALPALALVLFALAQSLPLFGGEAVSFDPYETRLVAARILAATLYALMLLRYADTEGRLRALVYVVVLTGVACALFGIARQAGQREELGFFFLPLIRRSVGYAQFVNRNHFAFIAEISLGLALGVVVGRGVARERILIYVAASLPIWAALVLANSRGGIFAMLCQLIFLGATFGATRAGRVEGPIQDARFAPAQMYGEPSFLGRIAESRVARALMAAAFLAAIVVGMVWLGGDSLADRMASVSEEAATETVDATRTGRKEIWAATLEMFKDYPVAGVGFGGYWIAISRYHKGSGSLVPQQAHNDYLETLASGGVLGVVLVLLFIFLLVKQSRLRLREGSTFERAAALGALTGLVGVAVHSLVEFGLHVPSNAFAAVALVAIAAGRTNGQKTNHDDY